MNARVDHVVVLAHTLAQGEAWARRTFGVAPARGGQHLRMGTYNLLLRVGSTAYLEIIAIDPTQAPPARPRWFEMDRAEMQASVKRAPRLIHFVARSDDLTAAMQHALHAPGEALALERGAFRWRITVPADGALIEHGLVPTLIQWDSATPCAALPQSGVQLTRLIAKHPDAERLRALHQAIALEDVDIESAAQPELIAQFTTDAGAVHLSSRTNA